MVEKGQGPLNKEGFLGLGGKGNSDHSGRGLGDL